MMNGNDDDDDDDDDDNKTVQNTVPSDMIMMGGSFVFGRETSANSRPPCVRVNCKMSVCG